MRWLDVVERLGKDNRVIILFDFEILLWVCFRYDLFFYIVERVCCEFEFVGLIFVWLGFYKIMFGDNFVMMFFIVFGLVVYGFIKFLVEVSLLILVE